MRQFLLVIASTVLQIAAWQPVHAQAVPTRTVRIIVESPVRFARQPLARALVGGAVLVVHADSQLVLRFDSTLTRREIVLGEGATTGQAISWPITPIPLLPYNNDSTLVPDFSGRNLIVLDNSGMIVKSIAFPVSNEFDHLLIAYTGHAGTDAHGRLVYAKPIYKERDTADVSLRDTLRIVAGNFETRRADSVSWFSVPRRAVKVSRLPNEKRIGSIFVNPFSYPADEWVTTSKGILAILRASDYSVDWVGGATQTTHTKLNYPWVRISEQQKQARVDSMKQVFDSLARAGRPYGMSVRGQTDTLIPKVVFSKFSDMPEYHMPFRSGALQADQRGNIWILPIIATSGSSDVIYDVANESRGLFEHVRVPGNCLVAGFGEMDNIFLTCLRNTDKTWSLARAVIDRN